MRENYFIYCAYMSFGTEKSQVWSWNHGVVGLALRVVNRFKPGIQLYLLMWILVRSARSDELISTAYFMESTEGPTPRILVLCRS